MNSIEAAWLETLPKKIFDHDDDDSWKKLAKCLHHPNKAVFYPAEVGSKKEAHEAKLVCAVCPVVKECLDYANRRKERFGIWGGLTTKERVKLRRKPITNA